MRIICNHLCTYEIVKEQKISFENQMAKQMRKAFKLQPLTSKCIHAREHSHTSTHIQVQKNDTFLPNMYMSLLP